MESSPRLFAAASGALLLLASACTAYRYQHAPPASAAPMAAELVPSAPPPEFLAQSTADQLARVSGEIAAVKQRLDAEGKYNCCVEPACDLCLLERGECHCHREVQHAGPCGECTAAWAAGRGALPGVDAWDILLRKLRALKREEPAAATPHRH
jgi:hypothetical protein